MNKSDEKLHKAIDVYVEGLGGILVGRALNMGDEDSRNEFKKFLYKHAVGIVTAGDRIGLLEGMDNPEGVG